MARGAKRGGGGGGGGWGRYPPEFWKGGYSVKILECESFLIVFRRNSKKWTFLLRKILKSRLFFNRLV